jgi:hypothetical protein
MALNLIRNARAFFTTKVDATTGVVSASAHTTNTTFELQVLDGLSFSQNSNSEQVTINEAGTTPIRGQRSFNTSLAPVDFSFSTYIRPYRSTNVKCEESVLWNALMGTAAVNTALTETGTYTSAAYDTETNTLTFTGTDPSYTGAVAGDRILINGITSSSAADQKAVNGTGVVTVASPLTVVMDVPYGSDISSGLTLTNLALYSSAWGEAAEQSIAGFHRSNTNQLQKFGMLVIVDSITYAIDNCALNEATIDFGLDGIATVQWTGQATALRQLATTMSASGGSLTGGIAGDYTQKNTDAGFITNKLSTCTLKTVKALGSITAGTPYYLALTGGSITISNNITYITPAILGIVNKAFTYFTGTRSITGTLNAYLNTGAVTGYTGGGTGNLLKDMLAAASTVTEPMFASEIAIGGGSNALRVELQLPSMSIGVPSVNTEQVVSTAITFTASGSDQTGSAATTAYNLDKTNDLTVRYYAP